MKQISKESAARMCAALEYALGKVRDGPFYGLCAGIGVAYSRGIISGVERNYLERWIHNMLSPSAWLESYMGIEVYEQFDFKLRYQRRKPWVKWMIQHLKETT